MLDTRWDAVLADFRRYYHLDLREALCELPAVDLVALISKLPEDSALAREEAGPWGSWDAHKENTARLLEIESYKLQLAWADRIADPDDQDAKRARAQAKRAGIKPPPHPMVPPVAMRPHELSELRIQEYMDQVATFEVQASPTVKSVGRASFDRAIGATD